MTLRVTVYYHAHLYIAHLEVRCEGTALCQSYSPMYVYTSPFIYTLQYYIYVYYRYIYNIIVIIKRG